MCDMVCYWDPTWPRNLKFGWKFMGSLKEKRKRKSKKASFRCAPFKKLKIISIMGKFLTSKVPKGYKGYVGRQ